MKNIITIQLGFKVSGVFDDVCGSPYTGEAETLCFVLAVKKSETLICGLVTPALVLI